MCLLGAPDAPQVCHVVGEPSGKQAELDCVLGYQGGATVILDVVAIKVSSSPDLQATQNALDDFTESLPRATVFATGLQPETSYQLKIYASNEHGRSSTAHEITIMTGGESVGQLMLRRMLSRGSKCIPTKSSV